MTARQSHILLYGLLLLAVLANASVWMSVRDVKTRWLNVPPVPSEAGILAFTLGDHQFAYRFAGLMLQNLGDVGGRSTMLKNYNYTELTRWFFLTEKLDAKSDFVPYLASFYFGAVQPPETMRPILSYLRDIGQSAEGEKWRWLVQATYLARYELHDAPLALTLAYELSRNENPQLPSWARQMPGFVLNDMGKKTQAYDFMTHMLKTQADKFSVQDVNYLRVYICSRILTTQQAQLDPYCSALPY